MRRNRDLVRAQAERLAIMKKAGVTRVCVRAGGFGDDCRMCRALDRRQFSIDDAPALPPRACRCRQGCKCTIVAVV